MNLHYVEAACIDNWSVLDQQAKPMQDTELKVELCPSPIINPPVKVESIINPPVKVESIINPPVKVEFIPPPKLIGVCTVSQQALIYMPDTGRTHQQPLRHGARGLAEAVCPDGQVLTTLCPNSKVLPPNPPLPPNPLP
eukprot:2313711-Amphidinium_carterae.1